jgi:hypothetical protein
MHGMVAFCGITCSDCKAFIATPEDDEAKKRAIAEEWKIQPEEVDCTGCLDQRGRHISYWDTCDIRKCGTEKGVENCAYFAEYACEKLGKLHEHAPKARETLEGIRK